MTERMIVVKQLFHPKLTRTTTKYAKYKTFSYIRDRKVEIDRNTEMIEIDVFLPSLLINMSPDVAINPFAK